MELKHKYTIVYTFGTSNGDYGHSETSIETDHPIETHEDMMEVSRSIAASHSGFTSIAINKITEVSGEDD